MDNTGDNSDTTTVSAEPVNIATIPIGGLIPQPDGRGALRRGNPGNKGGPGRPPKDVQHRARTLFDDVLDALRKQLEDEGNPLSPEQLVAIGNMSARYSGLKEDASEDGPITLRIVRE